MIYLLDNVYDPDLNFQQKYQTFRHSVHFIREFSELSRKTGDRFVFSFSSKYLKHREKF